MADVLVMLDASGLILSAILATMIGRKSVNAYSLTGRSYLLNFSAGFFCLAISYLVVIGTALYLFFPPPMGRGVIQDFLYTPDVLPRLVVELVGFALIASSYYSRDRTGSVLILGLITAAAVGAVVSTALFQPFANLAYDGTVHLFETALLSYTLVQISRSYATKVVPGSLLVSWGVGMFLLSQYTWVLWSYGDTIITAEIAMALRVSGLITLAYVIRRRPPREGEAGAPDSRTVETLEATDVEAALRWGAAQLMSNMSYDRFKEDLLRLQGKGLVTPSPRKMSAWDGTAA